MGSGSAGFQCPWPSCERTYDRRSRLFKHFGNVHIPAESTVPSNARSNLRSRSSRQPSPHRYKSARKSRQLRESSVSGVRAIDRQRRERVVVHLQGEQSLRKDDGSRNTPSIIDLRTPSLSPDTVRSSTPESSIDTDTALLRPSTHVNVPLSTRTAAPTGPRWAVDNDISSSSSESPSPSPTQQGGEDNMGNDMLFRSHGDDEPGSNAMHEDHRKQLGNDQSTQSDADDERSLLDERRDDELQHEMDTTENFDGIRHEETEVDELGFDDIHLTEEEAGTTPSTPIRSSSCNSTDISPFTALSKRTPKSDQPYAISESSFASTFDESPPPTPTPTPRPFKPSISAELDEERVGFFNQRQSARSLPPDALDIFIAAAEELLAADDKHSAPAFQDPFASPITGIRQTTSSMMIPASTRADTDITGSSLPRTPPSNNTFVSPSSSIDAASLSASTPGYALQSFEGQSISPTPMPLSISTKDHPTGRSLSACPSDMDTLKDGREFGRNAQRCIARHPIEAAEALRLAEELLVLSESAACDRHGKKEVERVKVVLRGLADIWLVA